MHNAAGQFAEFNKANVAQVSKVAALALENTERLAKMNLLVAKSALAQGVEGAQAVAGVKDVQELFALRTKFAESGLQAAIGYSKDLYELATEAQAQYAALAEEAWADYTKGVATWVDEASKSAPAGSDVAINAFKSTFVASTAAIDQISKATKQVVSLADASVRAAAANATKVAAATKGRKAA